MPESEIENCIDGYEGEFASVFESAGRSVERARTELAALRAKAERAGDAEWQRLKDCELIVLVYDNPGGLVFSRHSKVGDRWTLFRFPGDEYQDVVSSGPIVDGLPLLTPKARAAIVEAVKEGGQ